MNIVTVKVRSKVVGLLFVPLNVMLIHNYNTKDNHQQMSNSTMIHDTSTHSVKLFHQGHI